MEANLPRYLYHTLYYVTQQSDSRLALEEFIAKLQDDGYTLEVIEKMQFTIWPVSKVTNTLAVSGVYWT